MGDLILWIKTWFKENFCIHDYKAKEMGIFGEIVYICKKCGRIKPECDNIIYYITFVIVILIIIIFYFL